MNLIVFDLEITLDKLALNNHFMLVVIGDLNAKSETWYPLDRTIYETNKIKQLDLILTCTN